LAQVLLTAQVYLEMPTAADVRDVVAPPGARIHWFSHDDIPDQRPGTVVLAAVRRAAMPAGPVYAWVAGESRLATSVRRHLVYDRGVPKADISFAGYWRYGWSAPG
jgi:NADPH-dependent ferric siderophore reductase